MIDFKKIKLGSFVQVIEKHPDCDSTEAIGSIGEVIKLSGARSSQEVRVKWISGKCLGLCGVTCVFYKTHHHQIELINTMNRNGANT